MASPWSGSDGPQRLRGQGRKQKIFGGADPEGEDVLRPLPAEGRPITLSPRESGSAATSTGALGPPAALSRPPKREVIAAATGTALPAPEATSARWIERNPGTTWRSAAEHRPHHAVPDVCLQTAPAPADRLRPEPGGRQRVPLVVHRPVPKPVRLSATSEAILAGTLDVAGEGPSHAVGREAGRRRWLHEALGHAMRTRTSVTIAPAGREHSAGLSRPAGRFTRAWFPQRAHPGTVDSTRGSARVVHRKTCRAGPAACPPAAFHAWWSSTFPRADRDDPVPRH